MQARAWLRQVGVNGRNHDHRTLGRLSGCIISAAEGSCTDMCLRCDCVALRRGRETHAARAAPCAPSRRQRACSSGSSSLVSMNGAVRFVPMTSSQSESVSSANGATTAAKSVAGDVSRARRVARECTHAARTLARRVVHEQVELGARRRRGGRRPGRLQRRQQRLELPRRAGAALGGRLALGVRQQLANVALELRHALVQLGARRAVDADHGVALSLARRVPRRAASATAAQARGKRRRAAGARRAAAWRGAARARRTAHGKLAHHQQVANLLADAAAAAGDHRERHGAARVEMRTGRRRGSGKPVDYEIASDRWAHLGPPRSRPQLHGTGAASCAAPAARYRCPAQPKFGPRTSTCTRVHSTDVKVEQGSCVHARRA